MKIEPHGTTLTNMACFLAGLLCEKCGSRSEVPLRKRTAEPHWRGLMPPPCLLQCSINENFQELHRTARNRTHRTADSPANYTPHFLGFRFKRRPSTASSHESI